MRFCASFQQQKFYRWIFMLPCVSQRPAGSVDISIWIGPAIEQHPGDIQLPSQRRVPQRHAPGERRFFPLIEQLPFIDISAEVKQEPDNFQMPMIYGERQQPATVVDSPQQFRLSLDQLTNSFSIRQCDRRVDRDLCTVFQKNFCYCTESLCILISRICRERGAVQSSQTAQVNLSDTCAPLNEPRHQLNIRLLRGDMQGRGSVAIASLNQ